MECKGIGRGELGLVKGNSNQMCRTEDLAGDLQLENGIGLDADV